VIPDTLEWMSKLGKDKLDAAQKLFRDPDFLNALEQGSVDGAPSTTAVNKLSLNKQMRAYAKQFGITDLKTWLRSALSVGAAQQGAGAVGPESAPGQPTPMMPR
jgi:hypothetical protein